MNFFHEYNSPSLEVRINLPMPAALNSPDVAERLESAVETAADLVELFEAADGRAWRGIEGSRLRIWADDLMTGWALEDSEGGTLDYADDWKALPAFLDEAPPSGEDGMVVFYP